MCGDIPDDTFQFLFMLITLRTTMPSETWKNEVGSALTVYASDQTDANWDLVKKAFVEGWATESQAAGN